MKKFLLMAVLLFGFIYLMALLVFDGGISNLTHPPPKDPNAAAVENQITMISNTATTAAQKVAVFAQPKITVISKFLASVLKFLPK